MPTFIAMVEWGMTEWGMESSSPIDRVQFFIDNPRIPSAITAIPIAAVMTRQVSLRATRRAIFSCKAICFVLDFARRHEPLRNNRNW
jgi:hypothetical protein